MLVLWALRESNFLQNGLQGCDLRAVIRDECFLPLFVDFIRKFAEVFLVVHIYGRFRHHFVDLNIAAASLLNRVESGGQWLIQMLEAWVIVLVCHLKPGLCEVD